MYTSFCWGMTERLDGFDYLSVRMGSAKAFRCTTW